MTQPEEAVGGVSDTVVAAEPTLEERLSAALSGEEEETPEAIEETPEPAEDGEGEPEITEEDVADEEADEGPPIPPPVSWTAEEKDEFAKLPRAVQETLARRETEREKFVQSKAREATHARSEAEREALTQVSQLQKAYADELARYAAQMAPQEPDLRLLQSGVEEHRVLYFQQEAAYRHWSAQQAQAQRQAEQARQSAEQADRELQAREAAAFHAHLQEHFPEVLDPANTKLRDDLGSIAREMGYPAELLSEANATDLIALKKASEWRADALKYRTLMAKKMEKVREAKNLPKVSKPGVPQGKGASEQARYAADREAMKRGDKDAELRVLRRFI